MNSGKYYPHFLITGTNQLLGVNFIDGKDVIVDKPTGSNGLPINETIGYFAQISISWKIQYC